MSSLIDQYKELHKSNKNYGNSSLKYLEQISLMIDFLNPKTILDFGCGKGSLVEAISRKYPEIEVFGYDPAIPERTELPNKKIDFIINTDVLEHIPEAELPEIVDSISKISQNVFFGLHHAEAKNFLPNGENAHCTIKPPEWYHHFFKSYFSVIVPLSSYDPVLSAVVTFNIPNHVLDKYNNINDRMTLKKKIKFVFKKITNFFKK